MAMPLVHISDPSLWGHSGIPFSPRTVNPVFQTSYGFCCYRPDRDTQVTETASHLASLLIPPTACCKHSSSSKMHLKWKSISLLCSRPWHFPRAKPWAPVMAWEALHDVAFRVPEPRLRLVSPRCTPAARGSLLCLGKPAAFILNTFYPRAPPGWNALLQMTTGIHFLAAFASAPLGHLHEGYADHTAPWSPPVSHCSFAPHPFSFSTSCVAFCNPVCLCMRFLIASLPVLESVLGEDWNLCLSCLPLCSKSWLGSHTNQA